MHLDASSGKSTLPYFSEFSNTLVLIRADGSVAKIQRFYSDLAVISDSGEVFSCVLELKIWLQKSALQVL
jgi:hypothetical protein